MHSALVSRGQQGVVGTAVNCSIHIHLERQLLLSSSWVLTQAEILIFMWDNPISQCWQIIPKNENTSVSQTDHIQSLGLYFVTL